MYIELYSPIFTNGLLLKNNFVGINAAFLFFADRPGDGFGGGWDKNF